MWATVVFPWFEPLAYVSYACTAKKFWSWPSQANNFQVWNMKQTSLREKSGSFFSPTTLLKVHRQFGLKHDLIAFARPGGSFFVCGLQLHRWENRGIWVNFCQFSAWDERVWRLQVSALIRTDLIEQVINTEKQLPGFYHVVVLMKISCKNWLNQLLRLFIFVTSPASSLGPTLPGSLDCIPGLQHSFLLVEQRIVWSLCLSQIKLCERAGTCNYTKNTFLQVYRFLPRLWRNCVHLLVGIQVHRVWFQDTRAPGLENEEWRWALLAKGGVFIAAMPGIHELESFSVRCRRIHLNVINM